MQSSRNPGLRDKGIWKSRLILPLQRLRSDPPTG